MRRLTTGLTWDGQPVVETEMATVALELGRELVLRVEAPFFGDPAPHGAPGPTWALWEHEVAEVFVAGPGTAYTEIELGPHGHHLVLRLDGVRNIVERELPIEFTASIVGDRWTGVAVVPVTLLPPRPWRVNLVAIHRGRYLSAARLGGARPDFHQPDRFLSFDQHDRDLLPDR